MSAIAANLQAVQERVARAARAAQRSPGDVVLLAVSKTIPAERIAQAHAAGQRAFGENTAQEAVEKITNLAVLLPPPERHVAQSHQGPLLLPLEWHFIGPIQSNKTSAIAAHFQWVHSVDRARIAERLNAARPEGLPPLNVCIQVNVSGEATKSGVAP